MRSDEGRLLARVLKARARRCSLCAVMAERGVVVEVVGRNSRRERGRERDVVDVVSDASDAWCLSDRLS